jgi:type IV secretion system protein VirB8
MKKQSRETLDAYYADAASWNTDRLQAIRKSQRVAWLVAGAALVIAVLEAGALIGLAPLKTVEPYTLLVDRTTGYVQALKPLNPDKVAPDTALTQSFLVQYVIARESFDFGTVNTSYRKVALLSAGRARSSYLQSMQVSNAASPLVIYPRGTEIETRVKSVSPAGKDVAMVRFDTIRTDPNGQSRPPSSWIAVIRYRYSGEPMNLADRFVNPLGFQVVSYRTDPEAMPTTYVEAESSGTGPAAPGPGVEPGISANATAQPASVRQ